jgi:DHA1 family bicyclomycin/chloramphenicol resistance-like MFS transporter
MSAPEHRRPVLAPSLGQGLLEVGTWRWTFDTLLLVGLIVAGWTALRLPETKEEGAGGAPLSLGASLKLALQTPQTLGYAIGAGFIFGCLMSYVSSAQQVFVDVFHLGANFPIAFGAIASLMALAALTNAHLVERIGMRRVSHTALTGFVAVSVGLAGAAALGLATLPLFAVLMGALFFLFGLIVPNFNALAMEPQGHNAGMASSLIGFTTTGAGAVFGGIVGHLFNGTVLPLALGFSCLSIMSFATVLRVEGLQGLYRPAR